MTSPQTPATEAGRLLLDRLDADDYMLRLMPGDIVPPFPTAEDAILAIEAEARADALTIIENTNDIQYAKGRTDALRMAADAVRALHGKSLDHGLYAGDALLGWTTALRAAHDAILDPQP